uniref:Retrovirus-related Pol polyprotein from transposon TNT 1-94-like beta-barrel domain-containing protein n=1 Tax=Lactuca sativa TaxID=4236 RepID=A0A9R1XHQ2_LACSA|nr:hypothetical protein LSAT_V11C400161540 [Lactuca sativa]
MIQPFHVTNNLFSYIDGTIPCPPSTISVATSSSNKDKEPTTAAQVNPEFTIWVLNDAHVRMIVLSTISERNTSQELWLALERAFAPHTSSREYTLKTQLLKIQMKPDESSSAYLTRAQAYSDALANIGEPMKEKDLVMLVLSGLREEYNGLKSTILARQVPIPFVDLHALLLDHDYMISKTSNELQPLSSQQPQAHYTNRSHNNRDWSQNTRPGNSNNNRGRGNYNNRIQGGGTRNQCGIGHVPPQCPNRDPSTLKSRQAPSANYADYLSQASNTGSSHHVASNLSSFDNSKAYYGEDNLHVGNGKGLPILHIGSSSFYSPNKTFNLKHVLYVPAITQNLLSVQQFCQDNNVYFEFHSTIFLVKDTSTHNILHKNWFNNQKTSMDPFNFSKLILYLKF